MADEYIKKDSALKEISDACDRCGYLNDKFANCMCCVVPNLKSYLREIPAADVAPVIHCEHCDNWNEWDHSGHKSLGNFRCSCAYWTVEDGPTFYTAPTDFCSYAEPRDPHES